MIRYFQFSVESSIYFYKYFVEDSERYGIVSFDTTTGDYKMIKISPDDTGGKFAFKVIRKLQKNLIDGSTKKEGIIAWY